MLRNEVYKWTSPHSLREVSLDWLGRQILPESIYPKTGKKRKVLLFFLVLFFFFSSFSQVTETNILIQK